MSHSGIQYFFIPPRALSLSFSETLETLERCLFGAHIVRSCRPPQHLFLLLIIVIIITIIRVPSLFVLERDLACERSARSARTFRSVLPPSSSEKGSSKNISYARSTWNSRNHNLSRPRASPSSGRTSVLSRVTLGSPATNEYLRRTSVMSAESKRADREHRRTDVRRGARAKHYYSLAIIERLRLHVSFNVKLSRRFWPARASGRRL